MIILKKHVSKRLNIVTLKKFRVLQNVLFFITNLSQGNFLHCPRFFMLSKNLNTACTPIEMKQKVLHYFLSSRWVSSFSPSSKISFLNDDREWARKNILLLLFGMIMNKLFCVTANITVLVLLPKFRIPEEVKLS